MSKNKVASKFNWLLILAIGLSVAVSSITIATFLLTSHTKDIRDKDRLHIKGLASSIKWFIDNANNVNYLLSINPEIVKRTANADKDWEKRVNDYKAEFDTKSTTSEKSGHPVLVKTKREFNFVELFFIQDHNGDQVLRSRGPIGKRGNRWWYKKFRDEGDKPFFSKSYYSITDDKPVASAFHGIYKDDKFVGIMGTDINFDTLQEMTSSYLDSKGLYALVIDTEGVIIAHPDRERLKQLYNLKKLTRQVLVRDESGKIVINNAGYHTTRMERLDWEPKVTGAVAKVLSGNSGVLENVMLEGTNSTLYYHPVLLPGRNDGYGVLLIRDNSTLTGKKITICAFVIVITLLLTVVLSFTFKIYFSKIVLKPLEVLTLSMRGAMPDGSERVELKTGDEFEVLANSYNEMNDKVTNLNKELKRRHSQTSLELEKTTKNLMKETTDKEEVESKFKRTESELNAVFEALPDLFFRISEDGIVLDYKASTKEMLYVTPNSFLNKKIIDVMPPDISKTFMDTIEKVLLTNEQINFEYVLPFNDDPRTFEARMLPLLDSQAIVIVRDIHEQKMRALELETARIEADAANNSKSEFLANMSHEIRTPMNAIIGFTDLMVLTDLNIKQKDYVARIKTSSITLLSLINDILDFSKIEAGKLEIEVLNFNLLEVMENLTDMFAETAISMGLDLQISVDDSVPINLVGDPLRLGQVLINLTSNAIKFAEGGKVLTNVALKENFEDRVELVFSVKDSGIGIETSKLKGLFDSFKQADGSTTRKYGGTGLGLAICKRLVEMMGGTIDVTSKKGEGSEFYFTMTFDVAKIEAGDKIEPKHRLEDIKALVVDDSDVSRALACRMLETMGMKTQEAEGGYEAFEMLKKEDFGLIMLDWKMPELNGIEATKMIKTDKSLADIPIIMMTAFGKKDEMVLAKKNGIDAFLSKPFTRDHLLGVVMNIFGAFNDDKNSGSDETHMIIKDSLDMGKLSGAEVLLVEDYELNRQVVLEILEHYNVKADIAENGKIGVEKAALKKYDAILMDVQMPEMDGIEASKRIRAMEGREDVPIIAMTAHAMKGDKERFLESGMTDYISKPINIEKIVAVLTTRIKRIASAKSVPVIDNKIERDKSLTAAPIGDMPGVNVEVALKRINNNRDLFVELLKGFVEAGSGLCDDVKTSIEKGNIDEAARTIHNLKGISGAISADDVHDIVKKLEESVRGNGENMADLINKTSKSLEIVLQSIDIFLKNETKRLESEEPESLDESLENPDFDIIKQTVSNLFDYLGRHDLDAEDELIKLKSYMKPLGDDFSDNLKELAGSIEKFNYIDATKTLKIISKAIKGLG